MTAADETLSRRAVTAWTELGLGWMPGMLAWDPQSDLWKWREGEAPPDGIVRERYPDDDRYSEQWHGWLPDLADHATLGCIEHGMLPEAWGPGHRIEVHRHQDGGEVVVRSGSLGMVVWCSGSTASVAEGLVACLEAAAERRRQR